MIKKIFFYFSIFFILCSGELWATPPTDIQMTYDFEKETLSVEAAHVSNSQQNHYIHTMTIYKNDEAPNVIYFTRQMKPSVFSAEVPLKAKPGDVIRVAFQCIKGGFAEATLVIADPENTTDPKAGTDLKQKGRLVKPKMEKSY